MGNYKKDKVKLDFYTKNSVKYKHYVFKNKKIEFNFRLGDRK